MGWPKNPFGKFLCGILLFALFGSSAFADGNCRKGCPQSDNGLLKYTVGNVYEYEFDSILTIGLNAGSVSEADDTSLKLTGNAKVYAEGNCGYTLQLNGIKVTYSKESIEKKILSNIQKPVHFTLVNGKLLPEICSDSTDTEYSLNIKRAIISLLQSSIESDTEVDVFGQCSTHTSTSKVGSANVVTKVRNLNECIYREKINSGLVSGVINEKAGVTNTFLLQADYTKESKVERGVVENVQLVESYKFTGTPKGNSDVYAKVVTTLKIKAPSGSPAALPASGSQISSIIFQKADTHTTKNIAALKSALTELVDLTSEYVKKDSAKKFVELIRLLRNADTDSLLELGTSPHPNKVLARKVYLDALFRTNTAESAKAIIKQLNKLDEKEKTIAILSLNLVETVDKETLSLATTLLTPNAPKEIYLSVGNLVSKFVSRNDFSQSNIELISKKFIENLKHCKASTKKDEERILYILKGIGNTEKLANNVVGSLAECASTGRSIRIRVAALQAFEAISCNQELQKKALLLLRDNNEDSELRIEAYLAAINCPNAELANEIAEIVNSEQVRQVGGFIASNLKAIRDSTDSRREQQRHFLGNIRVTKQFPIDIRRYSYNNELSYKIESLGLSASSDYKLIYSQQGFLPRSARLNVTTEIFGTNFNVFEASIRQENLERVLEYYAGPKGLLNKDFDEIVKLIEVGNSAGTDGRSKRSIADDSTKIAKKYKSYGNKNGQDLNLDISLKLFGSELTFLSLGDNVPSSLDDIIKHFSIAFENSKRKLSAFDESFIFHSLFIDTEFTYPTGVGVPLELSAQGFTANKIDFGVNVDIDSILEQNWQRTKYRLKVVPSIDLNLNLQLGFNAHVLSTGLRLESSAHSAVGSDVSATIINDGNGFNFDVELPRDKLELLDIEVQAEFYMAEQDKPLKSVTLKANKNFQTSPNENCFNQLEIVGFSVCFASTSSITDISITDPKSQAHADEISLARPFSFSFYVTTERKFNLKGTHVQQTSSGSQQWKLDFSTPGSKISHDTSIIFELGTKPRTYGRLSFINPQFNFGVEAGLTNDNKEMVIYGQYEQNNDVKKSRIGFLKQGNEYRPIIEIQDKNGISNNINGYTANGKVVVQHSGEKQSRYTFNNFKISNQETNDQLVINGWADTGPAFLITELRIAPNQQSYLVKSNFKLENNAYDAGIFVNDERFPENIYGGSVKIVIADQNYNFNLVGKAALWSASSSTGIIYSNSVSSSKQISQDISVSHKNKEVIGLKFKALLEENKFELDGEATQDKKLSTIIVKFQKNQRAPNDYSLNINAKYNKHFIDVKSKSDVNGNIFVIDNILTTSWGTALSANGELGQRYSLQDIHIDLHGSVKLTEKEKPMSWILKVIGTPDKTTSEIKLQRENADVLKFNSETQHPQDKVIAGKANLVVRNLINAKSEFKVAKNGKGEITAIVETQKTEPKHKIEIESKFHIQAPKYDVEASVIFDSDKKVYIKTENNVEKAKFSTKNTVEVSDKKVSFDANGNIKGEWRTNGDISGNFVLTVPDGRVVDGNLKRKVITNPKTGLVQGNMDLQINDNGVSGKKRSLSFIGKLDRWNAKTKELSVNSQLIYSDADEKKIELKYHVINQLKGNKKALDVGASISGNVLHTPTDISIVLDEYNTDHAVGSISVKSGERFSVNLNGKYNIGDRATPCSYELQGNLNVPDSKFKFLEITTHGKFLNPSSESGGAYLVDFSIDEKTGNNQYIRANTIWKGSQQQGTFSLDVENNAMQGPLKLDGFYQRDLLGLKESIASAKLKYGLNINYAEKYFKSTSDINLTGTDSATLQFTLDTSSESVKDIEFDISGQKGSEDSYGIKIQAKLDGKVYDTDSKIYRSPYKKGLDIRASLPSGQPIVIAGIVEILSKHKGKININIQNLADLDFKLNTEASFSSIDEYQLIADWNSKKLKLDNYNFVLRAQGKSITVLLKKAKSDIFSGTGTYALKTEKNRSIIEGQGQVTHNGKTHNGNFKLIRQIYDINSDKEVGFSYAFNGNFGPKNGVSTLKITNKDFNIKISICEEKKQCTNVQVQSIINNDEQQYDSAQHALLILIDLRELGYPYEFELQSKISRQGLHYQYNLDSNIISNNNLKYQLMANVLPSSSMLAFKLPRREILLETKHESPTSGNIFGNYVYSTAFYADKLNKPNDVARFTAQINLTGVKNNVVNAKGEIKLQHPTIRTLTVTGNIVANREQRSIDSEIVFDIFRVPEQKIVATIDIHNIQVQNGFNITTIQKIQSNGLQFHYEFNGHTALKTDVPTFSAGAFVNSGTSDLKVGAHIVIDVNRLDVAIDGIDEQILTLNGNWNKQKNVAKLNSKLQIFGLTPVLLSTEVQPNLLTLSFIRHGLIDANFGLKLGKEFKFDIIGINKPLINGRVALDNANFLQTTYKANEDDINSFLKSIESEIEKETEISQNKIKTRFEKLSKILDQQVQLMKDSIPDFSKIQSTYVDTFYKIIEELENDPSLESIIKMIRSFYKRLTNLINGLVKIFSESYEKLHKSLNELIQKLQSILKETVFPAWEEFILAATKIIGEVRVTVANIFTETFKNILSLLEKYGPALKNYGKALNDFLKPLQEAVQDLIRLATHTLEEIVAEVKNWLSKLPTFEAIRNEIVEKLQKLKLIEKSLEILNNLFDQLHIIPQTPEMTDFLKKAHEYLEAKLKDQRINDEEFVQDLLRLLLKAVRSIFSAIESNSSNYANIGITSSDLNNLFSSIPYSFDFLTKLPVLLSFRFSLINYILNENWENILSRNLLKSWVLFQDFELRGHIADGHQFFTFDGQHFSYPGSCKYILAQDSIDNNFTIVAQLNNGKLKSITLVDRDGNFAEITDTSALKVNGNPTEYPQHISEIHAWREYYTLHLLSEYGVKVLCTTDLKVCHVQVNGFYTSKTRGLLGNGNAEPYDDFIQIDGTLATNSATFGNSYGLTKCNQVTYQPSHTESETHNEICNDIFGIESPLALNYLALDSKPYRKSCDIAVRDAPEKEKEATACTIALAYGSALKAQNNLALLPSRCLKCNGAVGQRELGDEFTVKIPNKQADVVFVVDINVTPTILNNLVGPAILEIRESLKSRGFTDVQIGVIAFNESQRYPAILTSNNGKLNYQGKLADVQLNGPKSFCDNCIAQVVSEKRILEIYEILERLIKRIVPQPDELAFGVALNYPFRSGAAKSIIGVRSDSLEYNNLWKFIRAHITGTVTKFDGALLHLIAPVKSLSLEGVPSEKLVGFNSRLVATVDGKDNKKRSKLQFENDMGIDFVLNNGGWVFSTQNFDSLKSQDQKKVLNQVISSIADTLFKTDIVSDCRCLPIHGIHAQHKCVIKSSTFTPNKKPKTA